MKSFYVRGLVCALGLAWAVAAQAQHTSLLPLPQVEAPLNSPYAADVRDSAYVAALPGDSNMVRKGWVMAGHTPEPHSPSDGIGPGARLNSAVPEAVPAPHYNAPGVWSESPNYREAAADDWGGGSVYGAGRQGCFYVWGGGLIMTRSESRAIDLAYNDADPAHAVLTTDVGGAWNGGFEVGFGFSLGANHKLEVSYWGLYPATEWASVTQGDLNPPGNLNSTLDFGPLVFDDGNVQSAVNDWYNNSSLQYYRRDWEVHNVEVNLLGGSFGCGRPCGAPVPGGLHGHGGRHGGCSSCDSCAMPCGGCYRQWNLQWLAGIRYFNFNEDFLYAAYLGIEDPYYEIHTRNHLVGFQIGGRLDYCMGQRWNFFAAPKFGIYNNHARMSQRITNPEAPWTNGPNGGIAEVGAANTINPGQVFDVNATEDRISFLGQVDVGFDYYFTNNWKASFGYRAVAVTGVALTLDQIPVNFGDIDGLYDIDTNGSLILHGAFLQTEISW